MLEVETLYKNYPLRGTLSYEKDEGYSLFLEYELAAFHNKNITLKDLDILETKQMEYVKTEDYELAEVMRKLIIKIKSNIV